MAVESDKDIILIESGDMFEGTRDQFRDCFFYNATNEQILGWCKDLSVSLHINNVEIYNPVKNRIL